MATMNRPHTVTHRSQLAATAVAIADEVTTLLLTLVRPSGVIAEVEQMRALQVEAQRIEATQPERAAVLRQRASKMGMR
jgi:hypothetical protein